MSNLNNMPPSQVLAIEAELLAFTRSVPPPPYSLAVPGRNNYDFTPVVANRPRLPENRRNPYLSDLSDDACLVKFQTIVRENREIVVGRIKVPTPGASNHAFILRRYDTDAISLTTMYKVAFPGATEEDEKREMDWVKSSFETLGMNGGPKCDAVRLAGQWVTRHCAVHIAPAYGLLDLILALARASPDPNVAYRKSQRSLTATEEVKAAPVRLGAPVPSMSTSTPAEPVAKRQRQASPPRASVPHANDERHITVEATTTITGPPSAHTDMEAEIAQAKQMVVDLRRELQLRSASGQDLEDQGVEVSAERRGKKRVQDDDDEGVVISGGSGAKSERIIRKNKKVEEATGMGGDAGRKIAWGAFMFGLGVGAVSFIPQLASNFPGFASQFF